MKLIVGLGNPGTRYANTRHNIGFRVLDAVAEELGTAFDREKYRGQIAEAAHARERVLLLKPMTFMNLSGESVARAARNSVSKPEDLLVIYDEVEIPLGTIRIRKHGSPGTHNGMKSVIERVGTRDVPRMRVGVGQEHRTGDLADHVLAKFHPDERVEVEDMVQRATQAVLRYIEAGIDTAMNEFNGSGTTETED